LATTIQPWSRGRRCAAPAITRDDHDAATGTATGGGDRGCTTMILQSAHPPAPSPRAAASAAAMSVLRSSTPAPSAPAPTGSTVVAAAAAAALALELSVDMAALWVP